MSTGMSFVTPEQIAAMLGVNRKTVIDRVTKADGFPNPVNGRRKPVWLEDEVRKFFKRKSAQSAHMVR